MTSTNWPEHAACRDSNPALFTGGSDQNSREAKRICGHCPVQRECLNWSLLAGEPAGVWGGTTAGERRKMLRIAPDDAPNSSRQGRTTELTQTQIDTILWRLDHGAYYIELEADLRIGRAVCRRVWREHRDARTPPGRRTRNDRKSVLRGGKPAVEVFS